MSDEPTETTDAEGSSLRGTFIAVLMMAAFFVLCWFGMYALLLSRR